MLILSVLPSIRDKLCVIDWKTSSTPRPSVSDLFDFPLQVAAYAGAINQDPYFRFKVGVPASFRRLLFQPVLVPRAHVGI